MICGQRAGDPAGNTVDLEVFIHIDPENPDRRILTWTADHTGDDILYKVVTDRNEFSYTDETTQANLVLDARDHIQVIEVNWLNSDFDPWPVADSPADIGRLKWTEVAGSPATYGVFRSDTSGVYVAADLLDTIIAGEASYVYYDEGLLDDTWYYNIVAYDGFGNEIDSNEVNITVDGAPEPPKALTVAVVSKTLTLTYTASTSADIASYNIYRSANAGDYIELSGAVHDTDTSSPWSEDVSALTGHFEYLMRAVDGSGNEEGGLAAMVAVDLTSGVQVLRPNEPEVLRGEAAADGEVRVIASYDSDDEAGVAATLKLYVNNGSGGAIDWNTPVGSTAVITELGAYDYTIESSGLSGGLNYQCGVRALTAGSVASQNTDYITIATDATAPSAAVLTIATV